MQGEKKKILILFSYWRKQKTCCKTANACSFSLQGLWRKQLGSYIRCVRVLYTRGKDDTRSEMRGKCHRYDFFLKAMVPAGASDESLYELMTKTGLWVWWRKPAFSSGAGLIAVQPASTYRGHRHSALLAYLTWLWMLSPYCHCCDTTAGELGALLWLLKSTRQCLGLSEQAHTPVLNLQLAGTVQFFGVEWLFSLVIYLLSPLAYGQRLINFCALGCPGLKHTIRLPPAPALPSPSRSKDDVWPHSTSQWCSWLQRGLWEVYGKGKKATVQRK